MMKYSVPKNYDSGKLQFVSNYLPILSPEPIFPPVLLSQEISEKREIGISSVYRAYITLT
jgi:hypothetical protein